MRKFVLMAAIGIGYVLGTRAGRERYEQIMGVVRRIKSDPRVQAKAHQAMDAAKQQGPVVADKVTHAASAAASAAASKVTGNGHARHEESREHHMAGPQGDLP